ncbi:MAG TPA: flagellar motor switch protein FliN [Candidatus Saccharimonadales bacterium]|nr:flagellar motor switch protein FliN [Candidatus Saccharimonadales bacterium]
MSDITGEQAQSLNSSIVQCLLEATSDVLSLVAATTLNAQATALDSATDAALTMRVEISESLLGLCEIAVSAPMSARLAALLTGEEVDAALPITSDTREAAAELIQQICGNAADRLRRKFGPLELKSQIAERAVEAGTRQLIVVPRDTGALEFELHTLHLETGKSSSAEAQSPTIATTSPIAPQRETPDASAAENSLPSSNRNLDLLLDIELGVTLRFGTRQMLLEDIIELCSGSVVELDRQVQDPVDLLIDGRVIARGEVVVVEGNYGLRILQVATQGEKIACLS